MENGIVLSGAAWWLLCAAFGVFIGIISFFLVRLVKGVDATKDVVINLDKTVMIKLAVVELIQEGHEKRLTRLDEFVDRRKKA
jgi:hypothetical protein